MEVPFALFGETTQEEQNILDKRQQQYKRDLEYRLASLSTDPHERSMSENRLVFNYRRQSHFGEPGIQHNLLSLEECQHVLQSVPHNAWTTARHSAFATTDIPIRTNPQLEYLEPLIKRRLFPVLSKHYGFKPNDLGFRDVFLVKYDAQKQKGLRLHTDGCLFSLTLLISHPNDFEGGGTYYQSIDRILYLEQGDCAYHDAHVMHSGVDITKGTRYILVGFIDTLDTIQKDNKALRI
ncbi:uncharacterized protein B0P05DRAFT_9468 [Gilbertella persicaria]|uniref:Fe2OG dioxygenase domain-containing protein n=1 Tax=Rhizopus stolonifer TaxID=4846 RepID=A0A367ITX1_RHIST|nr:uncharacterized protein B0P05DRAFT_9468 [Gilbertella persicaria]KAI8098385.1 hypothetical protein B0P05DRAFT_9468 [Gilbertella persicaria]RCH81117.1 hypothetical protein CU098_006192 [Rhizopus stolonifer]